MTNFAAASSATEPAASSAFLAHTAEDIVVARYHLEHSPLRDSYDRDRERLCKVSLGSVRDGWAVSRPDEESRAETSACGSISGYSSTPDGTCR